MCDSKLKCLLEIYSLHSQLADHVSQRRDGANRLYAALYLGLFAVTATLIRFGASNVGTGNGVVLIGVGGCGIVLAISWWLTIRSYKQLNREKFQALLKLEKELPFQFFTLEDDLYSTGVKNNSYWRLTDIERVLPVLLGLFSLALLAYGLHESS